MFNPQRKSKLVDIYIEERRYKMHLAKKQRIQASPSQLLQKESGEMDHFQYLKKLQKNKRQVKHRLQSNLLMQNKRMMKKLTDVQLRHSESENHTPHQSHFNSYFNAKMQKQKIYEGNKNLVTKLNQQRSSVPSFQQLKKEYQQNRRYQERCRKLPKIFQHEQQFRKNITTSTYQVLDNSRMSRLSKKN